MTASSRPSFPVHSKWCGRHAIAITAALGALGLMAAACGGGSSATHPSTQPAAARNSSPSASRPSAFGQLAAVSGQTLEVQNPQSGQVTVNLTSATVITQTVTATASDLASGECVAATGTKDTSGVISAAAVTISQPGPTGCTRSLRGQRGGFGGGSGGLRGGSARSGVHATGRAGQPRRSASFAVALGKVSSISGTTVQVQVRPPTSTTTTRAARTPITPASSFTFSSTTRWTKVLVAGPSALVVGQCVSAFGPSDSTGAVTARTLAIHPAGPNGCSRGLRPSSGGTTTSTTH
ncbi:MAG: hypothetical protein ACYCS7_16680 [Acidimicrobiales bacterium]